ncbi:hypothetical protein WM24_29585 [Burkholderia ubonensis]|uniref:Mom family adenine methylcarbamoylation protein n=1 Tax=Burkholderia ubonensis TaxID=101571 RepID=UPI00075254DE|nr:hypothetical protein [Burkholderia ubonensis]KWN78331.1 hypothetical protein WM24_29585 [Burkholderia ubonensis]
MSSRADLRLDWCTHEAATYAVMHWHYSKRMPMPPLVRIGVWERERFVGCVLFGRGASPMLGAPYGLSQLECCELVRIALTAHTAPVSRIVKLAIRLLRENSPGLRLIVSFADATRGHHGGIYQAGNWLYLGKTAASVEYFHDGRWKHQREVSGGAFGGQRKIADPTGLPKRRTEGKHRYAMPLDDDIRAKLAPHGLPYPKPLSREKQAMADSIGTAAV